MMELLIYTLCVYGIANTIIYANGPFHVFERMHRYAGKHYPIMEEMLSCFICLPWWIGFAVSGMNEIFLNECVTPSRMISEGMAWYVAVFADGAYSSAACWLINTVQDWFEKNTPTEE